MAIEIKEGVLTPEMKRFYLQMKKDRMRKAYEQDLWLFCRDIMGYKDIDNPLHKKLCKYIGRYDSELYLLPRGHLKSSIITIGYTLQRIASDPNIRILITNATAGNAEKFLSVISDTILNNDAFKYFWPNVTPDISGGRYARWNNSEILVKRKKLVPEGTVETKGVGGNLVSRHYDMIIYDDLVNPDNCNTKEQREGLLQWYRLSLSLLEPKGEKIMIGTRYHYQDLYQDIIESGAYHVVRRRAIESGKVIFPQKFDKDELDRIKAEQGSWHFSCQYLNEPIDRENAAFKQSQFKYFDEQQLNTRFYTTVDPTSGVVTKRSDYAVVLTCGITPENNLYVYEYTYGVMSTKQLIDAIFDHYERYSPLKIGIEMHGLQRLLEKPVMDEQARRRIYFSITPLKPHNRQSKEQRILALQPRFETGTIFLRKGQHELEEQLMKFPRGRDDIIDALAYQLQIVTPPPVFEYKTEQEARKAFLRSRRRILYKTTGY